MRHSCLVVALLVACPLATATMPRAALAEGGDRALALELFKQGRELVKNGDHARALSKFEAAAKLMRTFGILLNVAECQEKLGRTASAWATWSEARAVASGPTKADDEATAAARQAALEPTLSRLAIVVPSGADLPDLEIQRDGEILPRAGWGAAAPVDPGNHVVEARAAGRKAWRSSSEVRPNADRRTVTVALLEKLEPVPVVVTPPPPEPPKLPAPAPAPARETRPTESSSNAFAWTLVGGGAGLAVIGSVLMGVEASKSKTAASDGDTAAWDSAKTLWDVGLVGGIAGGVAVLCGGVLLLNDSAVAPPTRGAITSPWLAPHVAGWQLGGSF